MANEAESYMLLRVVEPDNIRKIRLSSRPSSVQVLITLLKERLEIDSEFNLLYEDPDFDGKLTTLVDINELPQKAVLHVKLDTGNDDSSTASTEILSDHVSSPERLCRWPPGPFPIPTFGFDVELILQEANKKFHKDGTHLKISRHQRHDILEKMGAAMYGYKAYPSKKELEKAAAALVDKHPCLKEKGGTGCDGWLNSLMYKMTNVRTTMRNAGCQEVLVNAGKKSKSNPDGERSHSNIKKPKLAEVNFLPNFPKGEDAESLEKVRQAVVEEMKKVDKNLIYINKLMQSTFSLRRQKIVVSEAPVSEVMEEWPALKMQSEVNAEFQRITNRNLPNAFYSELDKITPRLLAIFRQKASKTGKTADGLAEIFRAHDAQVQHDAITRRTTVLHALPIYLREESAEIYLKREDDMEEPDLRNVAVALLSRAHEGVTSPVSYNHNTISIVLEGEEVIKVGNFPEAFMVLFGLVYALHLTYPKAMKLTFEFIQKVVVGLDDGKLSPRLLSLRNELAV